MEYPKQPVNGEAFKKTNAYLANLGRFHKHVERLRELQQLDLARDVPAYERFAQTNSRTLLAAIRTFGPRPRKGKRGLRILSIGSGCGFVSQALSNHGHEVVNLDISHEALLPGRLLMKSFSKFEPQKGGLPDFVVADAHGLPMKDAKVDVVLSQHFLQTDYHALKEVDQERIMADSHRVLRTGGILLIDKALEGREIRDLARKTGFRVLFDERTEHNLPFENHTIVLRRVGITRKTSSRSFRLGGK